MPESRKQIISLRMNVVDLQKMKSIANRLNVRESDLYRFAVKSMLGRLAPLQDEQVTGRDLIPLLIECGADLINYFDLDAQRLERIVNGDEADQHRRMDKDDIDLLAMAAMQESYLHLKLRSLIKTNPEGYGPHTLLKKYLQEKYVDQDALQTSPMAVQRAVPETA